MGVRKSSHGCTIDIYSYWRIATALETKLGRTVELEQEIDDGLLGGAVIRAEDMVIDGSVKTRLQKLADSLVS